MELVNSDTVYSLPHYCEVGKQHQCGVPMRNFKENYKPHWSDQILIWKHLQEKMTANTFYTQIVMSKELTKL